MQDIILITYVILLQSSMIVKKSLLPFALPLVFTDSTLLSLLSFNSLIGLWSSLEGFRFKLTTLLEYTPSLVSELETFLFLGFTTTKSMSEESSSQYTGTLRPLLVDRSDLELDSSTMCIGGGHDANVTVWRACL